MIMVEKGYDQLWSAESVHNEAESYVTGVEGNDDGVLRGRLR